MLVLRRKAGEAIVLNGSITIHVLAVEGERVKLGISAPPEVVIVRSELLDGSGAISGPNGSMPGMPSPLGPMGPLGQIGPMGQIGPSAGPIGREYPRPYRERESYREPYREGFRESYREGDRSFRDLERPPYRDSRERPFGERPFGERPFAERPFGERPFGERSMGDRSPGERPFGENPFGERPFAERPFGERPFGDSERGDIHETHDPADALDGHEAAPNEETPTGQTGPLGTLGRPPSYYGAPPRYIPRRRFGYDDAPPASEPPNGEPFRFRPDRSER